MLSHICHLLMMLRRAVDAARDETCVRTSGSFVDQLSTSLVRVDVRLSCAIGKKRFTFVCAVISCAAIE